MPALTALAQQELRPVADALVSSPAARRWWEPAARMDQRFLEWDGWPGLRRAGGPGDVSAIALARFVDAFTPPDETGITLWSVQPFE